VLVARSTPSPSGRRAGDRAAAERAVADLIRALGLDPVAEPELTKTPARVADLYAEIFAGLDPASDPEIATFAHDGGPDEIVMVRDLPFHSLCVHHFIPFFGHARVAYLPGERIIGISGAARLLDFYARRPQLQERLTAQIADHLERLVTPRGVAVVIEARHLCMEMRGACKPGLVETRVVRGALAAPPWAGMLDPRPGP
jgi:GTP cyclohydrolase I